jgi:hypothetical protein
MDARLCTFFYLWKADSLSRYESAWRATALPWKLTRKPASSPHGPPGGCSVFLSCQRRKVDLLSPGQLFPTFGAPSFRFSYCALANRDMSYKPNCSLHDRNFCKPNWLSNACNSLDSVAVLGLFVYSRLVKVGSYQHNA